MTELRDDVLCGVKSIAWFIGKNDDAARRLCKTRQIPAFKFAGKWCLRRSAFLQMIEEREAS